MLPRMLKVGLKNCIIFSLCTPAFLAAGQKLAVKRP